MKCLLPAVLLGGGTSSYTWIHFQPSTGAVGGVEGRRAG